MKHFFILTGLLCLLASANAQNGSIEGQVLGTGGQPAQGVRVELEQQNRFSLTDEQGIFRFVDLKPGSYMLQVYFLGQQSARREVQVKAGEETVLPPIVLNSTRLNEVIVESTVPLRESEYVARLPLSNVENPQVYNTIDSRTLQAQIATDLDKALINAPGVTKLWTSTGRGGDGAGYYSMRGFAVQPTMVNGLPGLTNGSLDPAGISRIEVIKGPSGTLFGSSLISYGGLINTVTKKPYDGFGGELSYISGSYGLNRITADINAPLDRDHMVTARLNAAYHEEDSFQDAGFKRSLYVAPSLSYKANERLSFLISAEFLSAEGTNPVMLFLNRSNPLQYADMDDLNYDHRLSLTSDDITVRNPRYNMQAVMEYRLSPQWTSQTAFAKGTAVADGYYSYLWDQGIDKGQFSLYMNDQNARTLTTDIQQNFIGDIRIGSLRNRVVIGLDYFHRRAKDNSSDYIWFYDISPRGEVDYVPPGAQEAVPDRSLSRQSVDALLASVPRNKSNVREETFSVYASDVLNLTPQLLAMASLRLDYFNSKGDVSAGNHVFDQVALSPKFGLVYQPVRDQLALFANYMNGFQNVAPQTIGAPGGGTETYTFEPEHANQLELGVKTDLFSGRLSSTVSAYYIQVDNKVMADTLGLPVQGGEVESKGIELDLNLVPLPGLHVLAGYGYNYSKVLKGASESAFEEEGKRPGEAGPRHVFNAWATYRFRQGLLQGWGLAGGANGTSELIVLDSRATGRFTIPGYAIFGASLFYETRQFRLALKLDNLADKEYYSGWSTINPERPRHISASFSYRF